jgi:hypothetical protein
MLCTVLYCRISTRSTKCTSNARSAITLPLYADFPVGLQTQAKCADHHDIYIYIQDTSSPAMTDASTRNERTYMGSLIAPTIDFSQLGRVCRDDLELPCDEAVVARGFSRTTANIKSGRAPAMSQADPRCCTETSARIAEKQIHDVQKAFMSTRRISDCEGHSSSEI